MKGGDIIKTEYFQIFSILVSISSIFISFALGQWSSSRTNANKKLEERYYNLYIPFFKKLYEFDCSANSYRTILIEYDKDFIRNSLLINLEYLDSNSMKHLNMLFRYDKYVSKYLKGDKKYEQHAFEAEKTFTELVFSMKKESSKIAKKLKLEPVTEGIL